ncbi:hypothetical protein SAMN05421505_110146 [Sinosporangium album]|uniref:Uncharacterized protein n=1 Tax=Sinosporangium album TaxID=504805 RepID=A0A1G7Z0W1_9ACTN|nr:hypothetical protein SAMN05421505_110146 [Sinosporangium album]
MRPYRPASDRPAVAVRLRGAAAATLRSVTVSGHRLGRPTRGWPPAGPLSKHRNSGTPAIRVTGGRRRRDTRPDDRLRLRRDTPRPDRADVTPRAAASRSPSRRTANPGVRRPGRWRARGQDRPRCTAHRPAGLWRAGVGLVNRTGPGAPAVRAGRGRRWRSGPLPVCTTGVGGHCSWTSTRSARWEQPSRARVSGTTTPHVPLVTKRRNSSVSCEAPPVIRCRALSYDRSTPWRSSGRPGSTVAARCRAPGPAGRRGDHRRARTGR